MLWVQVPGVVLVPRMDAGPRGVGADPWGRGRSLVQVPRVNTGHLGAGESARWVQDPKLCAGLPGWPQVPWVGAVPWGGHRSPGWPRTCLDPPSAHPQGTYGAQQCWAPPSPVTSRTVTVAGRTWAPRHTDGCGAGPAWPRGARGLTQTTLWALTWVRGSCLVSRFWAPTALLHWAMGAPELGCQDTHPCRVQGMEQTHGGAGVVLAQLWCHPMGLQPLLCFLPSSGWFLVTTSPPAKTVATAWLRAPEMREAAATCEIRAWYYLSGSCEGTQGGHRQHRLLGSEDGRQWGGMGPSASMAGKEPPTPWGGSLASCLPLPHSTCRAGGTWGSQLQPPELAGLHLFLWVPQDAPYQGHFWGFPQG